MKTVQFLHLHRSFITGMRRENIFDGILDFSTSKVAKYTRSDEDYDSNL